MRCLVWAAVSTKPQANPDKDSLDVQIADARQVIARHENWHETREPLVIPGHSRSYLFLADAAAEIPEYARLMELARSGSIDLLICRTYDRLGRTDALVSQVQGYLRHHGVQILSLDMPQTIVDPEEYDGRLDRTSIWTGAIGRARAEDEMAELRRRHHFGMIGRTKKGLHPAKLPIGYRKGEDGVGIVHEAEAQTVRLVFSWYLDEGISAKAIAERIPKYANGRYPKTGNSVKYILQNPYYAGLVTWSRLELPWRRPKEREKWVMAPGQHEAIVSRERWEAAQREVKRRGHKSAYSEYPLSGVVVCGYCDKPMTIKSTMPRGKRFYRYYICAKDACVRNSVPVAALEEATAREIHAWVMDSDSLETEIAAAIDRSSNHDATQEEALHRSIESKQASLERWAHDYELGLLSRSDYYGHKARLADEMNAAEAELAKVSRKPPVMQEVKDIVAELVSRDARETVARWRNDAKRTKAIMRSVGLRVTVRGNDVEVSLDFA